MKTPLVLDIAWLRQAASTLLDHLEETAGPQVTIDPFLYWTVDAPGRYDLTQEPESLSVGDVRDSVEHLTRFVDHPDEALSFGLVWLGELLDAIGHQQAG